jgi:hypothetical protein
MFKLLEGVNFTKTILNIDRNFKAKDYPVLITTEDNKKYKIVEIIYGGYSLNHHKVFAQARRLPRIYEVYKSNEKTYILCEFIEGKPLEDRDLACAKIRKKIIEMIEELNEDGLFVGIDHMNEMIMDPSGHLHWIDLEDVFIAPKNYKQQYIGSFYKLVNISPLIFTIRYYNLVTGEEIKI